MSTSRTQFFKAALMSHTSAAYLLTLSVLGVFEQTRDLFISEANQERWHIDKIRLPLWSWIIVILAVVIWRLVDHSHKEITARDERVKELVGRASAKEWHELAGRFRQVTWQVWAISDKRLTEPTWMLYTDDRDVPESLCKEAGNMLLKSPTTLALVSQRVRSAPNPMFRWLWFISEKYNVKAQQEGDIHIHEAMELSANACVDCAANES
jgi:hypothetical protein